ncbi:MAG: tetratricopeptide repeat protein [Syntrophobacteraceae bacterium]
MRPHSNPGSCPKLWKILLLLAITLLSYTSALKGGYIWDDDLYLTDNKTLTSVHGLASIWAEPDASPQYYPLVFTTFWLERQVWGLNPFGYHLVNVLLHACVACLLYYLLLCLEVPAAWFAALLFAVHPLQVETAAWISERKNVLSGFFYMLSAVAFLRFYRVGYPVKGHVEGAQRGEGPTKSAKNMKGGHAAAALNSAALPGRTRGGQRDLELLENPPCPPLEKGGKQKGPSTSPRLPVDRGSGQAVKKGACGEGGTNHPPFVKGGRGDLLTRLLVPVWPALREDLLYYCAGLLLFGCALLSKTVTCTLPVALLLVLWWKHGRITLREALSLAPLFALGAGMGLLTASLERTNVGASGSDWSLSFLERFLVAGRVLCFYAWKLLWPAHLSFNYQRWAVESGVWQQYLYPLAVAAVLLALWMARGRIGRGPLAAALFFAASLFPALGFFDVFPFRYSYVADHFQYLAGIGPITLVAAVAAGYVLKHHSGRRWLFTAAAVLVVSLLSVKTWSQGNLYADAWTLWNETLRSNPESSLAHNNIGSILAEQGKHQEALTHFSEALRVSPNREMPHYNMGVELAALGRNDEAMEQYEAALRIRPDFERALNNLGSLLAQKGRFVDAVRCWKKAVEIKPDYLGAHCHLLMAYSRLGDSIAARREYGIIKRLDPAAAEEMRHTVRGLE